MTDFPVMVARGADGGFVLRIPALALIVEHDDLAKAWAALETEKTALIERHRRIGAEMDLPRPEAATEVAADRRLRRFAVKAAIVSAAACIVLVTAAMSFAYALREPLRKSGMKVGRAAIAQLESGLRDAAHAELTPEKREALRQMVADAAPALKPYMRELRPILAEACDDGGRKP